MEFSREELIQIRERANQAKRCPYLVESWKRAYEKLADAADYLDAKIARTNIRSRPAGPPDPKVEI